MQILGNNTFTQAQFELPEKQSIHQIQEENRIKKLEGINQHNNNRNTVNKNMDFFQNNVANHNSSVEEIQSLKIIEENKEENEFESNIKKKRLADNKHGICSQDKQITLNLNNENKDYGKDLVIKNNQPNNSLEINCNIKKDLKSEWNKKFFETPASSLIQKSTRNNLKQSKINNNNNISIPDQNNKKNNFDKALNNKCLDKNNGETDLNEVKLHEKKSSNHIMVDYKEESNVMDTQELILLEQLDSCEDQMKYMCNSFINKIVENENDNNEIQTNNFVKFNNNIFDGLNNKNNPDLNPNLNVLQNNKNTKINFNNNGNNFNTLFVGNENFQIPPSHINFFSPQNIGLNYPFLYSSWNPMIGYINPPYNIFQNCYMNPYFNGSQNIPFKNHSNQNSFFNSNNLNQSLPINNPNLTSNYNNFNNYDVNDTFKESNYDANNILRINAKIFEEEIETINKNVKKLVGNKALENDYLKNEIKAIYSYLQALLRNNANLESEKDDKNKNKNDTSQNKNSQENELNKNQLNQKLYNDKLEKELQEIKTKLNHHEQLIKSWKKLNDFNINGEETENRCNILENQNFNQIANHKQKTAFENIYDNNININNNLQCKQTDNIIPRINNIKNDRSSNQKKPFTIQKSYQSEEEAGGNFMKNIFIKTFDKEGDLSKYSEKNKIADHSNLSIHNREYTIVNKNISNTSAIGKKECEFKEITDLNNFEDSEFELFLKKNKNNIKLNLNSNNIISNEFRNNNDFKQPYKKPFNPPFSNKDDNLKPNYPKDIINKSIKENKNEEDFKINLKDIVDDEFDAILYKKSHNDKEKISENCGFIIAKNIKNIENKNMSKEESSNIASNFLTEFKTANNKEKLSYYTNPYIIKMMGEMEKDLDEDPLGDFQNNQNQKNQPSKNKKINLIKSKQDNTNITINENKFIYEHGKRTNSEMHNISAQFNNTNPISKTGDNSSLDLRMRKNEKGIKAIKYNKNFVNNSFEEMRCLNNFIENPLSNCDNKLADNNNKSLMNDNSNKIFHQFDKVDNLEFFDKNKYQNDMVLSQCINQSFKVNEEYNISDDVIVKAQEKDFINNCNFHYLEAIYNENHYIEKDEIKNETSEISLIQDIIFNIEDKNTKEEDIAKERREVSKFMQSQNDITLQNITEFIVPCEDCVLEPLKNFNVFVVAS